MVVTNGLINCQPGLQYHLKAWLGQNLNEAHSIVGTPLRFLTEFLQLLRDIGYLGPLVTWQLASPGAVQERKCIHDWRKTQHLHYLILKWHTITLLCVDLVLQIEMTVKMETVLQKIGYQEAGMIEVHHEVSYHNCLKLTGYMHI